MVYPRRRRVGDGVWLLRTWRSAASRTGGRTLRLHQRGAEFSLRARARAHELLAARRADAHGSQKREIQSRGLVVCALCGLQSERAACKAPHAACRKVVEQRANEA